MTEIWVQVKTVHIILFFILSAEGKLLIIRVEKSNATPDVETQWSQNE